jgi:hypothetical protein
MQRAPTGSGSEHLAFTPRLCNRSIVPDWRIAWCFAGKGHRRLEVATAPAGALDLIAGLGGRTVVHDS